MIDESSPGRPAAARVAKENSNASLVKIGKKEPDRRIFLSFPCPSYIFLSVVLQIWDRACGMVGKKTLVVKKTRSMVP
jgi:hypothetical protein